MRLPMMAGLCALLCACNGVDQANEQSNIENAALAAMGAPLPKGWRYSSRHDEIRGGEQRMAARVNDDTDPLLANAVTLAVQFDPEGPPAVFFNAVNGTLDCPSTCGVAYRADNRTGVWSGRGLDSERLLLDDDPDVVKTLLSARTLIVELPTERSAQYRFDLTGLRVSR
ncbi:MAG TPA: hypothetical protein VK403_09935 [Allosphingosinicella sp.]|nr:hypothetical protein [Allosphingosinicella sp.]